MKFQFSKPFTLDRTVRLLLGVFAIVSIVLLFRYLSPVLLPFFIAWLLAYLFHPIVLFFQNRLKIGNRTASVLLVLFLIFSFIGLSIYFLAPILFDEITRLKDFIVLYTADTNRTTPYFWEETLRRFLVEKHIPELIAQNGFNDALNVVFPFAKTVLSKSVAITGGLVTAFFTILYLFFILKDYQTINALFISLIPQRYQTFVSGLMQDVEQGMSNYYRGQSLVALILCVLYAFGFYLIDMPVAILMGLIVGALNLIPYLQIIAIPPAILLMLVHSLEAGTSPLYSLLLLLVVFVVIQVFQDGFLVPRILGKRMGLNAAVVLLSLSIFGMLFGLIGLIIALPITTLLLSYYKRFILSSVNESALPKADEKCGQTEC